MPAGVAINRHWVMVMKDGAVLMDWGNGLFQDLLTGEFLENVEQAGSHTIQEDELEWLKRTARIQEYDADMVYLVNLPDRPLKTLE